MTKARPRTRSSVKTVKRTAAERIAELEATVARHERELADCQDARARAEVNAIITARGIRDILKEMANPDFVPRQRIPAAQLGQELFPEPPKKGPAKNPKRPASTEGG